MLVGAISFSDAVDAGAFAADLGARTCRSGALHMEKIAETGRFACLRVYRGKKISQFAQARSLDGEILCVSGNIPWEQDRIRALLAGLGFEPEIVSDQLPGHWAGVHYDPNTAVLRIFNDALGVGWTFVARMPWGYAFGPDFGVLVSVMGERLVPDYEHMLVTLGLGYALDASTCFENICLLPAAAVFRCESGKESWSAGTARYAEPQSDSLDERMRRFGQVLDQVSDTWMRPVLGDLDVSLSAGLDCRYGLGLMLEAGHKPKGFTFGHANSDEVRQAQQIARSAGMSTEVYEVGATHWEGWCRCVEQTGAVGGFHWPDWLGWLKYLGSRSNRVLIGFLGDAFSGKHLLAAPGNGVDANLEAWAGHNVDGNWLRSEFLTAEARRDSSEVINESIRSLLKSAQLAHGYQAQLHLDWYGRQRRFTSAQPNLMHNFVGVVPFLYEPAMMAYWACAPAEDLADQRLYREYAARRFPGLFVMPSQKPALMQRLTGSARNALAELGPRWKARFAAPVLDPVQMLIEQKQNIDRVVTAAGAELSRVLDVERFRREISVFPQTDKLSAMQIRRVTNMAILLQTAAQTASGTAAIGGRHGLAGGMAGT